MRRIPRSEEHRRLGPAWSLHGRHGGVTHRSSHRVALTAFALLVALLVMLAVAAEQARASVSTSAAGGLTVCAHATVTPGLGVRVG